MIALFFARRSIWHEVEDRNDRHLSGARIPRPLIEKAGLEETVNLRIVETGVLIERASVPRVGWQDDAELIRERGEGGLLDEPTPTGFDETGWMWE